MVGAWLGFIWGAVPYDEGCFGELPGAREGAAVEVDDGIFVERCTETGPGGHVTEARVVYWFTWATMITVAAGAWFAIAGLVGTIAGRGAVIGVGVALAFFLLANFLFFSGLIEIGGPA